MLADERATTRAITERLHWLVEGAHPGDILVFHYSGHGSQVRDRDGDELDDGLDEIICPYDLDWDNPFTDDDLGSIIQVLPGGVNLTVILDCCHSGTGLREPVTTLPVQPKYLMPPPDIQHRAQPLIEDHGMTRRLTLTRPRVDLQVKRFGRSASAGGGVLIAACAADQVSADAWIDSDYHGALTYYLWRAVADLDFAPTYADLVRQVRRLVKKNGYDQVPQLEGDGALLSQVAFAPLAAALA
jgi:hypothetical protein